MRKWPLVPVALALMAGIVAARRLAVPPPAWLWVLAAASLLLGAVLLARRGLRPLTAALALVLAAGTGGLLCALELQRDWTSGCPEKTHLAVRLVETPVEGARSWRVRAEVQSRGTDGERCRGPLTLYLRRDSVAASLRCGDRLLLHGYPDVARRSVYVTSDHYIVTRRDGSGLRCRCEKVRMGLLRRMQRGPLSAAASGIAETLALGWRGDLEATTRDAFRDAGVAHLLAVSGLHVGLLAALVGGLLWWTGNERRGRAVRGAVQLLAVWGYALLTGLAPSTVRAALMFSLLIAARISGRRTPTLNLLAAAAIATLAWRPMLLYDVGWRLSYSAVAGIALAQPVIRLYRNRLWQASAVSTAATLATLPTVAGTFHRLPLYFLVANIVVVPAAGALMGLSLLYLALPCGITAWPLELLCRLVRWVIDGVAALPGAVVEGVYPGTAGMVAVGLAVLILLAVCQAPFFKPKET